MALGYRISRQTDDVKKDIKKIRAMPDSSGNVIATYKYIKLLMMRDCRISEQGFGRIHYETKED